MPTSDTPTADLLLHPVRWRIVLALQDRELTTTQLKDLLADVPQATLYRQIAKLARAEIVTVTSERKVRGAVERTYALNAAKELISDDEGAALDHDQHRRLFRMFTAHLVATFDRNLERADPGSWHEEVSYQQTVLQLSDDELRSLVAEMSRAVRPYLDREATPERRRFVLSTILIPDDASAGDATGA